MDVQTNSPFVIPEEPAPTEPLDLPFLVPAEAPVPDPTESPNLDPTELQDLPFLIPAESPNLDPNEPPFVAATQLSQNDTATAPPLYCATELLAASFCVSNNSTYCPCFDPDNFFEKFPKDAEQYFRSTLGYRTPDDPEFCLQANWQVCLKFHPQAYGAAACCCREETQIYMQCMFRESDFFERYGVTDKNCEYDGCDLFEWGGARMDDKDTVKEGPNMVTLIGWGSLMGFLVLLAFCLYGSRRMRKINTDEEDVENGERKSETKNNEANNEAETKDENISKQHESNSTELTLDTSENNLI